MDNETIDVQPVEETTPSPSEETQTAEAPQEAEVKQVPYDRFKEVVEQRNKYKELLAVQANPTTEEQVKTVQAETGASYEEAIKIVEATATKVVSKEIDSLKRQMDLDRTATKYSDFYQHADLIKQKIQENPRLGWEDAYKLAKFDINAVQAKEAGKQEAYRKIEQKKAASVESATKSKPASGSAGEIDPLAKGPDGKFLYSTKELEDILPKT